jgi:iron complex outermembrane receptor protein
MAQTVTVKGIVTDEKENTPMTGLNVSVKGTTNGVMTDDKGAYELKVPVGRATLSYSYVGYRTREIELVAVKEDVVHTINVKMTDLSKELDIVVVSGNKIEKKLGEQTQSIEVLKGQNITQSSQGMAEAMNKVPGVNMLGRTISIRGGSGFADATSNRTLVLMDDVPMVSPENGSVRWSTMPVEAIDQLELVKGPSTVTNGAQALNGLVNIRTINAQKDEPYNKIYTNFGSYLPFNDKSLTPFWSKYPPVYGGISYVHARKYGDVGVVFNGAYQRNKGYTSWNKNMLIRSFVKIKYTPHKIPTLSLGGTVNFAFEKYDDFFIYKGFNDTAHYDFTGKPVNPKLDSMVLYPTDSQVAKVYALNVNPYVTYYDKHENRHSLKTSYYYVKNNSTTGDSSIAQKLYLEYSFARKFKKADTDLAAGIRYSYKNINSVTFGNRYAHYSAAYIQVEKRFDKRFTIRIGFSLEFNKLDTLATKNELSFINTLAARDSAHKMYAPVKPVFNIGINYQITEGTFLRASFGQGYRFPDIAEQFVFTPRSGAIAFPNPDLKPESSWSAEVGIKQGMKLSRWVFYADLSAYLSRYNNLIEFVSTTNVPDYVLTKYPYSPLYSQAQNVTSAQIWGIEVSAIGTGSIFGVPLNFLIGYNYMDPKNLNYNPKDPLSHQYLYYRMRHSAKADIQTTYKGFIVGLSAVYIGHVLQYDDLILQLNKISDFVNRHGTNGDIILDARLGYNYKNKLAVTLIAKNVTNRFYTLRPGFVEAPASLTLQATYQWGKLFGKKQTASN